MVSNNLQPDLFKYYLTTSTVEDELLEFSPQDWDDSSINIQRDFTDFMGNKREFSLPLGFLKEGRQLLKEEFKINGVMGKGIIRIEILDRSTWTYSDFYSGKIDFAKADLTADFIEVNFLDSDIQAIKEAYEGTQFEIGFPLDNTSVILPPVQYSESANYFIAEQTASWLIGIYPDPNRILTAGLQDYKVRVGGVTFLSPQGYRPTESDPNNWTEQPIFEVNKSGLSLNLNIEMGFDILNASGTAYTLMLSWRRTNPDTGVPEGSNLRLYDFGDWGPGTHLDKRANVEYNDIALLEGYVYFLSLYAIGDFNDNAWAKIREANVKMNYSDVAPEGIVKSIHPFNLFQRLFAKMSGDENIIVSSEFLSSFSYFRITSGDAIRYFNSGYFTSNRQVIKTSFEEFFKSLDAVFGLGFDIIDGVPTIEKKEFFFKNDLEMIDVGDAKNLKITSAPDLIFNDILTGYEKEDYEENWGKQEINNSQTWKSPVSSGKKTLDISSPYRADPYGINEIRSKVLMGEANNNLDQDLEYDNDVFMVWCDPDSYTAGYTYQDNRYETPLNIIVPATWNTLILEDATSYSGIETNPYYFNWMISPKRNLLRHAPLLSSGTFGLINQDKTLDLTKADKWVDLTVDYGGETFDEDAPILISDLADPLFVPFTVTIEAAFPLDFYKSFLERSTGYITFWHNDRPIKIFPKDISFDIVERSDFEIVGILCPGQDLNDLFY